MEYEVNGIQVRVDVDGGKSYASYITEYAPDAAVHEAIAAAVGAVDWQLDGIGAVPGSDMNDAGTASWVMSW
jgi:hypothetical protein